MLTVWRITVGSNGASQAIIDALTITQELLAKPTDVDAALKAYQDTRLPPTARIVMANRANGPDAVLQIAEERAPNGFTNIYDVIPKEELEEVGKKYKAIAGMEMDIVNKSAKATDGTAGRMGLTSPAKWTAESS